MPEEEEGTGRDEGEGKEWIIGGRRLYLWTTTSARLRQTLLNIFMRTGTRRRGLAIAPGVDTNRRTESRARVVLSSAPLSRIRARISPDEWERSAKGSASTSRGALRVFVLSGHLCERRNECISSCRCRTGFSLKRRYVRSERD